MTAAVAKASLLACFLARCVLLACAVQQGVQHVLDVKAGVAAAGPAALQRAASLDLGASSGGDGGGGGGAIEAGWRYEHQTMAELVVGAGYPLEEHFVTTSDGYVLGLYRIPHGRPQQAQHEVHRPAAPAGSGSSGKGASRRAMHAAAASAATSGSSATSSSTTSGSHVTAASRPPVLLQHGLLDSSAAFVLNEPSESLGFILADAGFDVWLGNSRGNAFSRNHTGLDPAHAAFWDFTYDDMAAYDLPAVLDYILARCNTSQLAYVGHSQGTTQMFAALSSDPMLRAQLSVAVMLAPAVHMRYIQSYPLEVLAAMSADKLFNLLGAYEFLPSSKAASDLFGQLCKQTPLVCASIITAICGFNADNMNLTRLPTMVQYAPSGTSVKNMAHWSQAIRKSRERQRPLFQMYDYGGSCFTPQGLPSTCNMRVYHAIEPPSYELGAIDTPLAIFYGARDRLADQADVESLLEALSPQSVVYTQLEQSYEHIDFTWGIDAKDRIYPAVLRLLWQYRGSGRQQATA